MFSYIALKGMYKDGEYISPIKGNRWVNNVLETDQHDVESGFGIFATAIFEEAESYGDRLVLVIPELSNDQIMVLGESGWRAQRARIIGEINDPVEYIEICKQALVSGYPQIPIIETIINAPNKKFLTNKEVKLLKDMKLFEFASKNFINYVRFKEDVHYYGVSLCETDFPSRPGNLGPHMTIEWSQMSKQFFGSYINSIEHSTRYWFVCSPEEFSNLFHTALELGYEQLEETEKIVKFIDGYEVDLFEFDSSSLTILKNINPGLYGKLKRA